MTCWVSEGFSLTKAEAVGAISKSIDEHLSHTELQEGYPLPLLSHWNTGQLVDGFTPQFQLQILQQGIPLLPWVQLPVPSFQKSSHLKAPNKAYYRNVLRLIRDDHLPLSLVSTQWERLLLESPEFNNDLHATTPYPGAKEKVLSPFGPISDWRRVGLRWARTPELQFLISEYQDPPLVIFLSNNEQPKLRWYQVQSHREWLKKQILGDGSGLFSKKDFFELWKKRYQSLIDGFRQGLNEPSWQKASRFIGYNNFVPTSLGRWKGWHKYSDHFGAEIAPWTKVWQGANVPYYLHDWNNIDDTGTWSPQVEAMGWQPLMETTRRNRQSFWYELSIWDGYNERNPKDKRFFFRRKGEKFNTQRYQGLVRYGLWLTRPNVLREFRHWNQDRIAVFEFFNTAAQSVSEVHDNKVLSRFWKNGKILANEDVQHPFDKLLPDVVSNHARWFNYHSSAEASADSQRVRAFSLVMKSPQNDYLVYAYSPVTDEKIVEVLVGDVGKVPVPLFRGGSFHLVKPEVNGVFMERVL
ncbi:MAG: hypothetical protein MI867_06750 [Pseudomonadales bacterium]|nr:hypothetical protein [Pseudomonadales bacterium]